MQQVSLTDPTWTNSEPSALDRAALVFINDVRDVPFLKLAVLLTVTMAASGITLLVRGFNYWHAAAHIVGFFWFLGPYILMLHNTSHRKFFKKKYESLNHYIPWFLGPFFGETPDTYFAHHVGMHHPENNLKDDLSSTLGYRRDSIRGFTLYFLRFFFGAAIALPRYFLKKRRRTLVLKSILGEILFFILVGALLFVADLRSTLTVFVIPYLSARFLMMCGNWGQHAFVDQAAPENCYRNSITCINTGYNRRCFNDGYHIGHHVKQTRHWTEMPEDFSKNLETYAKEGAIVFDGIDFFIVWMFLMLKRYDWLARRYVKLDGDKSEAEIIELLKSRTRWKLEAA